MRRLRYYLKQVKLNRLLITQADPLNAAKTSLYTIHCSGITSREWRHFKQTTHSSTLYQPLDAKVPGPLCYISMPRMPKIGSTTPSSTSLDKNKGPSFLIEPSRGAKLQRPFVLMFSGNLNHVDVRFLQNLDKQNEGRKLISSLNCSIDFLLYWPYINLIYTLNSASLRNQA